MGLIFFKLTLNSNCLKLSHGCLSTNVWGSSLCFNPLFLASAKSVLTDEKLSESIRCHLNSKYFWNVPDCTWY